MRGSGDQLRASFCCCISSPHRCMRQCKARVRLGRRRRTKRPATGAHEGNTKCERQVVVQNEEEARPGGRLEAGVAKWHKSGAWWHKTSGQQNAVLWRQESRPGRQSLVREALRLSIQGTGKSCGLGNGSLHGFSVGQSVCTQQAKLSSVCKPVRVCLLARALGSARATAGPLFTA